MQLELKERKELSSLKNKEIHSQATNQFRERKTTITDKRVNTNNSFWLLWFPKPIQPTTKINSIRLNHIPPRYPNAENNHPDVHNLDDEKNKTNPTISDLFN